MANSSIKNLNIDGNVVISGSTTSIDVQQLTTDDNNITLNDIASPTDSNANAGGFTVKGASDKTFNWLTATSAWTASEHIDLAPTKSYKINNTEVLNATTLGGGIVNSSLTDVGTLTSLQIDLLYLDGSQIGLKTTDEDLITLTNNTVTVAGTVAATQFTGGAAGLTGISTGGITVPASAGDFLYNNAGAWGGITPPITVALGGTAATTAAAARTNLGVTATGVDPAYALVANNLSDLANAATARTNIGLGGADGPTFGGVGVGAISIEATPTSSPAAAPTFAGIVLKNIPVASGSGYKWVIGTEQDGDLDFSYFTIDDAGENTSASDEYMNLKATSGNKYVSIGSASIPVWIDGLKYPTADGTANQVLTTNGSTTLTFATPSTTNITEGTNLYYTDARAAAAAIPAVNWTNLTNRAGASGPAKINVGENAGLTSQGNNAVAIGKDAGKTTQGANGVAVGYGAGQISQNSDTVAVGGYAGNNSQGMSAVAVGNQAGQTSQGADAVAVGQYAGQTSQGIDAVAVGKEAGQTSQGNSAIAIGLKAGETNQGANSIVLSAIGSAFSPTTASAFFVNPIRNVAGTTYLQYNATTKEVTHIAATTSSVAEGSNLYYTNARADARADLRVDAGFAAKSTTNLSEGTNLYYTNTRADARIGLANLSDLVDVHTVAPNDGQGLTWDNGNSRWAPGSPGHTSTSSLTEGSNLYYTNARTDARIALQVGANLDLTGVTTTTLPEGTNLYYTDARADARATLRIAAASIGNLTDVTITTPATNAMLQYNGSAWIDAVPTTAHVTEGANLYYTNARADARIALANVSDLVDVHTASPSHGDVLYWDSATSKWRPATHEAVILANTVDDTHIDWGTGTNQVSTADIPEATNLFYTNARADARIALQVGANLDLTGVATTTLPEGTNLYYTNARADARIAAAGIEDLDNVTITSPAEGQAILQYTDAAGGWVDAILSTSDVTEGSNLYYTNARADARIVAAGSANWNTAYTAAITNATEADTGSTLVKRGSTGNIAASKITANNGIILGNMPGNVTGGIHWTGTDFQGYNGSAWVSLTSAATAQLSGTVATMLTSPAITSTSYVDIAAYTASITVTDSNIINVQVNVDLSGTGTTVYNIKIVRVIGGTPTDLYIDEGGGTAIPNIHFNASYADVHGQSTGTIITYKLMAKVDAGTLTVNPDGTNAQIFLSEITTTPTTVTSVNGAAGAVVLTTTNIAEGTNLYYTDARARAAISEGSTQLAYNSSTGVLTFTQGNTDTVAEGSSNLYYTTARWDTKMAAASTTNLSEGTNLYYTTARWDTKMAAADTDDLSEGSTNLYHQDDLGSVA